MQYNVCPPSATVHKVSTRVVKETMPASEDFESIMSQPHRFIVAIPCRKAVPMAVESPEFMEGRKVAKHCVFPMI